MTSTAKNSWIGCRRIATLHNLRQHSGELAFNGLGIAPGLLEVLEGMRFAEPTPIQRQAIPIAMEGKDLVGIAQTGTGKTLAFGIPMIQNLARKKGQGLVVLPTRELAMQVNEELHKIGRSLGLKTAVLIGGMSYGPQIKALSQNPHVVIATPGRLIDHLEQKTIKLDGVSILVLDEADRMFDMGFMPQVRKILQALPKNRQTMLFSATLPPEIMKIASASMKLPIRVEVAPPGTTIEQVAQEIFVVKKEAKSALLKKILSDYKGPTLVFARTRYGARRVAMAVRAMGHNSAEIHSNRTLGQRTEALQGFKSGKYRVLIATDIASRGIDVRGIELVVNYDMPSQSEDYVHRIGRTGRAGAGGRAITFALPEEGREVRNIEIFIKKTLPITRAPEFQFGPKPAQAVQPPVERKPQPKFSPFGRRRTFQSRRRFGRG